MAEAWLRKAVEGLRRDYAAVPKGTMISAHTAADDLLALLAEHSDHLEFEAYQLAEARDEVSAAKAERAEHVQIPDPAARGWSYGVHAAALLIAATSWPFEAPANREVWAIRLLTDRELVEAETTRAAKHMLGAIATLRDHLHLDPPRPGQEIVMALDHRPDCRHFGGEADCPPQCLLVFGDVFVTNYVEVDEEQP